MRRALNSWRPLGAQRAMLRRAGMALSPKGRAMLRSLNKWGDVVRQRALMAKVTTARAPARPPAVPSSLFPYSLHHSSSSRSSKPASLPAHTSPFSDPALPPAGGDGNGQARERLAFNGWVEASAELSRRRGLLSSFMPEPRAMRRALNSWRGPPRGPSSPAVRDGGAPPPRGLHCAQHVAELRVRAAAALDLRVRGSGGAPRARAADGAQCVGGAAAERREAIALIGSRAAAALAQRGLRSGLTAWVEAAADFAYRRGLLFGIASPKGRAMRRGLNSWRALAEERALMRRAGASLRHRGGARRRARGTRWRASGARARGG